jgi:hypothetical protein
MTKSTRWSSCLFTVWPVLPAVEATAGVPRDVKVYVNRRMYTFATRPMQAKVVMVLEPP